MTVFHSVKENGKTLLRKNSESLKGYLFLLPAIYGLCYFFLIPVFKSFLFSIGDVKSVTDGYSVIITGFKTYHTALFEHNSYRQDVVSTFVEVVTTTPLIIIYSFFMASIMNRDFRGRTFFRVVLFLPVIITAMTKTNTLESLMGSFSSFKNTFSSDTVSFTSQISDFLINAGISENIADSLTALANKAYGVISLSGVQILVLLISMQSISPALYEAAIVEGTTSWERFWKITFPMITPFLFTCVIYTIIDFFTRSNNKVMLLVNNTAFSSNPDFSLASAMGWIYFVIIGLLTGVVALIFSRLTFYYDN